MYPCFVLGPFGSHSSLAMHNTVLFSTILHFEVYPVFCSSNTEILHRTKNEKGVGFVAAENTSGGLVNEYIRFWLQQSDDCSVHVVGEKDFPIAHHLMVYPDVDPEDISMVYSHPQANSQCSNTIFRLYPQISMRDMESTVAAAHYVASNPSMKIAAIASRYAAYKYGLKIVHKDIQDNPHNVTRFHIIANHHCPIDRLIKWEPKFKELPECVPKMTIKTAVIFRTVNTPGSLLEPLAIFEENKVNISSLHSIPLGRFGDYAFYCEFECQLESSLGEKIIKELKKIDSFLLVLGSLRKM